MHSKLRDVRESEGITQTKLARKSDLSDKTVRNAEKGRVPTPVTVHKMVNALNDLSGKDYKVEDIFPGVTRKWRSRDMQRDE